MKRHLRVAASDETPALELVACREVGESLPVVFPTPPSEMLCGVRGPLGEGKVTEGLAMHEGWTDAEIATYLRRVAALSKGMTEVDAEQLAERMLHRDRPDSGDDRRICLECTGFKKQRCTRGNVPLPAILQRCDGFAMRGVQ